MVLDQIKLLFQYYFAPKRASSGVLDRGSFAFALVAAILVAIGLSALSGVSYFNEYQRMSERFEEEVAKPQTADDGTLSPEDRQAAAIAARAAALQSLQASRDSVTSRLDRLFFASSWKSLAVIAVLFVPICLIVAAAWAHLGSATTVLFRDYMPLLVNCLFAWTAAHLPVLLLWAAGLAGSSLQWTLYSQIAGLAAFLLLSAFSMESVLGVRFGQGLGVAVAGLAGSIAGGMALAAASSGLAYLLMSPWVLFYAYRMFGGDVRALGGGLASRQNFKRQLENATINPHDADAHYQLGLIYLQRRNATDAERCFRRALDVDREDELSLYELGKLLRQSNRAAEARPLLEKGAALNDKLANHEVWRELGALSIAEGRTDEALANLAKFVERREYDPEGLVLYGRALRAAGRAGESKAFFEQAIASARTAPPFRRHELKKFEKQAEQELKAF